MDTRKSLHTIAVLLVTLASLVFATNPAVAQGDSIPAKRLRSPATVSGYIGGESHDSYLIRARKGQRLTVRIRWRREENNRAEFSVSDSPDFGGQVTFGRESDNGRQWSGKVLQTGDYYIHVVAHPAANYTLKVTVK